MRIPAFCTAEGRDFVFSVDQRFLTNSEQRGVRQLGYKQWVMLLLATWLGVVFCGGPVFAASQQTDKPESKNHAKAVAQISEMLHKETETPGFPVAEGDNALTGLPLPDGVAPDQRPVALMLANRPRSLPQRGIASADVVYEMLVEGASTRLMAMYGQGSVVPTVGPVCDARDAFLQFAVPQNAVLVHIGSSVYTRNLQGYLGYKTVDGVYLGSSSFEFDVERSLPKPGGKLNEDCWFTNNSMIQSGMQLNEMQPTGQVRPLFHFAEQPAQPSQTAWLASANYCKGATSKFRYDEQAGLYQKLFQGRPHQDEDGGQLAYTNVLLLSCDMRPKADGYLLDYDLNGGDGFYFTAGGVQPIVWQKGRVDDPLRLFGQDGNELMIQPGKSYIGLLPKERKKAIRFLSKSELETLEAEAAAEKQKQAEAAASAPEASTAEPQVDKPEGSAEA